MRFPLSLTLMLLAAVSLADGQAFVPLFPKDGPPTGWSVRRWDDVGKPADPGVLWQVRDGVLHGSEPRGTWLVSDREYSDFVLEFEWKLGERGNSGCGLRFPLRGDPAFDGLELQMVDPRYYPADAQIPANELSGGLYRAVAPKVQGYRPGEWNRYRITCRGGLIEVVLNDETILQTQLDDQREGVQRHDGSPASPLKDRPRKGRIGFQELSRGGAHVEIRGARILELK
ncbi:MAG: hypothetical protein JWQ44_2471 [Chthoniobacter sp.]|nr:hypothetical protein [Chthoniobacter sp.]